MVDGDKKHAGWLAGSRSPRGQAGMARQDGEPSLVSTLYCTWPAIRKLL